MSELPIDIDEMEQVFQELELSHPSSSDTPLVAFLDITTGKIVRPDSDEELDRSIAQDHFISFPKANSSSLDEFERILNFVDTIEDGGIRITLDRLLQGRGALKRFHRFLQTSEGEVIREKWALHETERRRLEIRNWLDANDIEFGSSG